MATKKAAVKKSAPKKNSNPNKAGAVREEEPYKVGPGKPPKHTMFTKDNRPTKEMEEKRMKTLQKKKLTKDLIRDMLQMKYKFTENSLVKQQLIAAFGEDILEMTVAEIMTMQQMQKAILKGDSVSYGTLMDRVLGRPVQAIQQLDEDGKALPPVYLRLPKGMDIDLPSNTEGVGEDEPL